MNSPPRTLAEGCFGKIYKQQYNGTWAAVKKVPVEKIDKRQLDRECRVYYSTCHDNVVKLLGDPWLKDGKWNIPLEFIFGEDLETAIFNTWKSQIQLTSSVKATIITGMCEGLNCLHSHNIVHQNLKPDNIMVEHGTYRAVIVDMGLAKFFVNGITSAGNDGNDAYSAPEILLAGGVRDKRSDVWAMGKIITELTTRARMDPIVLPAKVSQLLTNNSYDSIVSRMLATHASERPSMSEVVSEIQRASVSSVPPKVPTPWAGPGLMAQEYPGILGRFCPLPPQTYNPSFAPITETPTVRTNSNPFQLGALIPHSHNSLLPQFSQMPFGSAPNGTMTQRHYRAERGQIAYRQMRMNDGRLVEYDELNYRYDEGH